MLQPQFKNVQFSFLLFFQSMYWCTVYFTKNVCSFFFFLYAVFNNVQVSSLFPFRLFFLLSCTFLFLFSFSFYFFFLSFFFFIINCSFNVPYFFSTLYLPLSLYPNTITIGSLPSLFNFSLQYQKLSLIYNTNFSIAYEHSSSFFFFSQNIPGFFSK